MLKPDLIEFKPKELAKSEEVNYNFTQMGNYVFGSVDELKALVNSTVANLTLQLNQSVFTGMVIPYPGKVENIPNGWLLCDGREVSREEYRKLYEAIDIEKYGKGDGVTTFNLPNYIDMFLEGGTEAGIVKAAAIPNIKGSVTCKKAGKSNQDASSSGALYITSANREGSGGGSDGAPCAIWNIDASRSSSVYKNGVNTVQPPAVTVLYIIKT